MKKITYATGCNDVKEEQGEGCWSRRGKLGVMRNLLQVDTQDKFSSTQARVSESVNQFAGYPIQFKSKVPEKAAFGN